MLCFLVDDFEEDRKIFLMALKSLNSSISLVTANNGLDALEKFKDAGLLPDYIFLDANMPYMSGKDCLIKLRDMKRLKDVPIIIYSTVQYFNELVPFGATGFMPKQNSIAALTSNYSAPLP